MYNVLIVDDNPADRDGVRSLVPWSEWDMRVVGEAADGHEGLLLAQELRPDIVLTDVSMPVLDGIQMVTAIRREMPDTGVVFMSCFDDFNYIKSALNLEAFGYILKPIDLDELSSVIGKLQGSKEFRSEMKRKQQELQRQLSESLPERRASYFERLLLQPAADAEIRNKMAGLQLPSAGRCIVVHLHLDDSGLAGHSLPIESRSMLSRTLRDKADKAIFSSWNGVVFRQDFSGLAGLLFAPKDEEAFGERVVEAAESFRKLMSAQLMLSLTIGVTEPTDDYSRIPLLYEQARELARAKFYHGGNRIVKPVDLPLKKGNLELHIQDIRDTLAGLLEQPDERTKQAFLQRLFNAESPGTERTYKGLALSVLNTLQTILLEKNESLLPAVGDIGELLDKVESFETMDEIRGWIGELLSDIAAQLNGDAGKRYMQIVKDIKSLIEEHYATDVSAEQIADRLHLSVSHANSIYRKITGQSIFESLVAFKMETAKQLLRNPYVKIYEVAEQVGYRNKSYFSAVFREFAGMSPRQYMDSHSERP